MKASTLIIIYLLLTLAVPAQELKLAGVDFISYGKATLKNSPSNEHVSFRELAVYLNIPTRFKNKKTSMINGLRYGWVQPALTNTGSTESNETNFHSISYTLRLLHPLRNNWHAGIVLIPTLAGDFKHSISGKDFVMQAAITFTKKTNETTRIGTGLTYTTMLGIPVPLPMAILIHNNHRHALHIYLPSVAEYTYAPDAAMKLKAGFRLGINGARFNYSGKETTTAQNHAGKINYSRANFGPVLSYKAGKYLQLEVFCGVSAMRRYRYQDISGNTIRLDSKASGFFNAGITLLPPVKQKTQ